MGSTICLQFNMDYVILKIESNILSGGSSNAKQNLTIKINI